MPATAPSTSVTICGPNLNNQRKGQFHVHAAGCADLTRNANREPEYRNGWTIEVTDRDGVVGDVYADMIYANDCEPLESYRSDLHFFPCCAHLPQTTIPEENTMPVATAPVARQDIIDLILTAGRVNASRNVVAADLEGNLEGMGATREDLEGAIGAIAATLPRKRPRYSDEVKARSQSLSESGPRTGPDVVAAVEAATIAALDPLQPLTTAGIATLVVDGKPNADLLAAAKAQCKYVTAANCLRALTAHAAQIRNA